MYDFIYGLSMERPDVANRLTRRTALRKTGLGVAGLMTFPGLLAACGSTTETGGTTTAGGGGGKPTGRVDYIGFQGEDGAGVASLEAFYKRKAIKIAPTYTGLPVDVYQRFKSGRAQGVDLVDLPHDNIALFTKSGLLQPLDPARIPNLTSLTADYAGTNQPWYVDGKLYGVPFNVGPFVPVWDSKVIKEDVTSWEAFTDPKYKGKVGFFAEPIAAVAIAAVVTGAGVGGDPWKIPKASQSKVTDWLKGVIANTRSFASSIGDLTNQLKSGDISLVFGGWGGFVGIAALQGVKTLRFAALPKEGTISPVELWCLARGADNADAVYAAMNQILTPKSDGEISALLGSSPTVKGAYDAAPALQKVLPGDPYAGTIGRQVRLLSSYPDSSDQYMTRTDVQAAFDSVSKG